MMFFFFKQKTAYEMRISDWSSDVCSSDLSRLQTYSRWRGEADLAALRGDVRQRFECADDADPDRLSTRPAERDARQSRRKHEIAVRHGAGTAHFGHRGQRRTRRDRKSTRLNSSH